MSEYQYYEFQTIESPLTREQMSQLRSLSSRAVITPSSFTNTYHFGDFRGNPRKLMESLFDAHVYVSNFGTVTFLLRLSRDVLPEDTLTLYSVSDSLDWWSTDQHTILEWQLNSEEPPEEWVEGEGWMAQLLPIRDELVRGDYRSLYIGWLSSVAGESAEAEGYKKDRYRKKAGRREPPVPPGLGSLTGAQAALAEFLGVSRDLIAAAAEASPELPAKETSEPTVDSWVAQLPEQEIRAVIALILRGEGLRVQAEMQSRYYRSRRESPQNSQTGSDAERRTAGELLATAAKTARERKRRESEERTRKRRAYLAGLVPRLADLWAEVNALAEEQKASPYDKATSLLVDMRDACDQADRRPEFDAAFARFMARNSRRAGLVRRLREVRLVP